MPHQDINTETGIIDPDGAQPAEHKPNYKMRALILGSIGVVYGDIGTSPLYAFREAAHHISTDGNMQKLEILGILSLIIWALIFIVTIKYVFFLLRADNKGEGGDLSLMALVYKSVGERAQAFVLFGGIVGAALFFGDATLTPAISVLSAVEGLKLASPMLGTYVLPISIFILILLFSVQKTGTGRVSTYFGPIMVVWFSVLSVMGVYWIAQEPSILASFNPYYGFSFLYDHSQMVGFAILGSVFLAVTGAEALYADLGHFGRRPIMAAWIYFVFPALVLNYLGQGALLLKAPEAMENPFYFMVPAWGLIPLIILATCATIIASQAVITGAFSLAAQAINMGLLPRMEIRRTSALHAGQIYIPKINQNLLIVVVLLCIAFRDSASLASAYGIAVSGTMLVSSLLAIILVAKLWKRGWLFAIALVTPFLIVEIAFFSANLTKFFEGGMVPLAMGAVMILVMYTWIQGSRYLAKKVKRRSIKLTDLVEIIDREQPHIVKGTAIYLTGDLQTTPVPLSQNLKHNRVLHERNIIVMVKTSHEPKVAPGHRLIIERVSSKIVLIVLNFGYMEDHDVPEALSQARWHGLDIDLRNAVYFLGKRQLVADPRRGLPLWQDHIYIFLNRYAAPATDFYSIPPAQVMEIGIRVAV
ncbi:MAG: potassium transporter Kup [Alphaproteobacteria bacterium]